MWVIAAIFLVNPSFFSFFFSDRKYYIFKPFIWPRVGMDGYSFSFHQGHRMQMVPLCPSHITVEDSNSMFPSLLSPCRTLSWNSMGTMQQPRAGRARSASTAGS